MTSFFFFFFFCWNKYVTRDPPQNLKIPNWTNSELLEEKGPIDRDALNKTQTNCRCHSH